MITRKKPLAQLFFLGVLLTASSWAAGQELQYPVAVAAGKSSDAFYLGDRKLPGVWQVGEGKLGLFFQGSKKYRTPLNALRCLALDASGGLLAGDSATREVYRFDADKKPQPLTRRRDWHSDEFGG